MPRISGVSATRRRVADAAQAEAAHRGAMALQLSEDALHERHLDLFRLAMTRCFVDAAQPRISSTRLPRFAAISSGDCMLVSAFIVARTTLIGLREP